MTYKFWILDVEARGNQMTVGDDRIDHVLVGKDQDLFVLTPLFPASTFRILMRLRAPDSVF